MDDQQEDARLAGESDARLAAAFRAAVADAPPPGFGVGDVVATSRRITRRRRSAVAGAALAVLAVAGVGVTAGVSGGERETAASAAGAPVPAGAPAGARSGAAPELAAPAPPGPDGPASDLSAPELSPPDAATAPTPVPGSAAEAGAVPPLGPGTVECADRQDPALRALVEQVLPEVVGAPEAATTAECRPAGERGLALEVREEAVSGLLSVTYLPPGKAVEPPGIAEPPAAVVRSAPTASGGTVLVASRAARAGDPSPFAGRLDAAVAALAPRL